MERQTPKCSFRFRYDNTIVTLLASTEKEAIERAKTKYLNTNIKRIHNYSH